MTQSLTSKFKQDAAVYSNGIIDYSKQTPAEDAWTIVQYTYSCCGVNGYSDYQTFTWNSCPGRVCAPANSTVPISCCVLKVPGVVPNTTSDFVNLTQCQQNPSGNYTYQNDCVNSIDQTALAFVTQYSKIAIGIAAGIVGLELILITFAFLMCCVRDGSGKFV